MTKLGLTLGVLFSTTIAAAQPKPQPPPKPTGFTTATTFQSCSTSWVFACGMRDADGRTFGTAHERKHCQSYTFQPNGTYSQVGDFGQASYGTYKMIGGSVRIMPTNQDGTKGTAFELVLSADGATLGTMKRL